MNLDFELNKIYNEDCLTFMKRVPDKYFEVIYIDPPYFEVKGEFDFIWKSFEDYLQWIETLAVEFKRILADNGSLFIWGHAKKIAYKQIIFDKYFNLENSLVWFKPDSRTKKGIGEYRSFAPSTERILFYSNEVEMTGLEMITEEFIKPNNPFAIYLKEEILKGFGSIAKFRKFVVNDLKMDSAMVNRWLDSDCVIKKEYYLKIKYRLNGEYLKREYEDLRREYEDLRREYEDKRRPFNNTQYEDVLFFNQEMHNYNKYDHPTQKPPTLTGEILRVVTRKGSKVYIPFCGSGTEAEQCKILGIDWVANEINPEYVAIASKRLEQVQGSLF